MTANELPTCECPCVACRHSAGQHGAHTSIEGGRVKSHCSQCGCEVYRPDPNGVAEIERLCRRSESAARETGGEEFEPTGEVRAPLYGEWFVRDGFPTQAHGPFQAHYPILRLLRPAAPGAVSAEQVAEAFVRVDGLLAWMKANPNDGSRDNEIEETEDGAWRALRQWDAERKRNV